MAVAAVTPGALHHAMPTPAAALAAAASAGITVWVWSARGPGPVAGPSTLALGVGYVGVDGRVVEPTGVHPAPGAPATGAAGGTLEVVVDVRVWLRADSKDRVWWQRVRVCRAVAPGEPVARGGPAGWFTGPLPEQTVRSLAGAIDPGASGAAGVTPMDTLRGIGVQNPQRIDWHRALAGEPTANGVGGASGWEGAWFNLSLWAWLALQSVAAGVVACAAALGVWALGARLMRRGPAAQVCALCGYPRRGLAGGAPCPECGGSSARPRTG